MAFPKLFSSEQKYHEIGEEGGVEEKAPVKKSWPVVLTISIFLNILLAVPHLLAAFRVSLSLLPSPTTSQQVHEVYSPAQSAISYEMRKFDLSSTNFTKYQGGTEEADKAWDDLYNHIGRSRISASEASQLSMSPSPLLKNPISYTITLDVVHELHCLNYLRKLIWPQKYNLMETLPRAEMHLDHCVDIIRQSLQCSADITPMPWQMHENGNLGINLGVEHKCLDWERIHEWAEERQIWDEGEVYVNGTSERLL